MLKSDCETV